MNDNKEGNIPSRSFSEFQSTHEEKTFSDWLRKESAPHWKQAVEHPFTDQLADGTLDRTLFARYLLEDLDFVETLIRVFGYAIGQSETMETKKRISSFLNTVTGDENDYFERALEALEVSASEVDNHDINSVNHAFQSFLLDTARQDIFLRTLAALLPAEWVYEAWARRVSDQNPDAFYFREWIELHHNPGFHQFVQHLRTRMNQEGPEQPPGEQSRICRIFCETVRLEAAFFDAVFEE